MKYLEVILDSRLKFKHHFSYIDGKVGKVIRALCRLLPNLRGSHERKRKLYAGVITVVIYAAPLGTCFGGLGELQETVQAMAAHHSC